MNPKKWSVIGGTKGGKGKISKGRSWKGRLKSSWTVAQKVGKGGAVSQKAKVGLQIKKEGEDLKKVKKAENPQESLMKEKSGVGAK